MAPNAKNGLQQRLIVYMWNSDGNPCKKPLFNKLINNPVNKSNIFVVNDSRLQRGEEASIRARYHNVEISNDKDNGHKPGGVAILIPKGAFVKIHTDGKKEQILATIKTHNHNIHLATQYAHKGQKVDENLVEEFTNISRDEIGIVLGDFNAGHTEYGGHTDTPNGIELKRIIDNNSLSYVPNEQYTYLSRRSGDRDNIIDVAFLNTAAEMKLVSHDVGDNLGSDHLPLLIEFDLTTNNEPIIAKITDEDKFKELQRQIDYQWKGGTLTSDDIDHYIDDLESKINKCKSDATHEKIIRTNAGIALSVETNELIKERRKLERIRKNKHRDMTTEQKQRSNWLNREIKRSIDLDKTNHLRRMGTKILYEENPKKRWEMINGVAGRNHREENFKALIKPDGTKTKDVEENVEVHATRLQETCSIAMDPRMDETWRQHVEEELQQHPEIFTNSTWTNPEDVDGNDVRYQMLITTRRSKDIICSSQH